MKCFSPGSASGSRSIEISIFFDEFVRRRMSHRPERPLTMMRVQLQMPNILTVESIV